jgi:hypothetical protein
MKDNVYNYAQITQPHNRLKKKKKKENGIIVPFFFQLLNTTILPGKFKAVIGNIIKNANNTFCRYHSYDLPYAKRLRDT